MRAELDLRPFRHQGVVDALGDAERLEERRLAALVRAARLRGREGHTAHRVGGVGGAEGPLADELSDLEWLLGRLVGRTDQDDLGGSRLQGVDQRLVRVRMRLGVGRRLDCERNVEEDGAGMQAHQVVDDLGVVGVGDERIPAQVVG